MALSWFVHSGCTFVLGYPKDTGLMEENNSVEHAIGELVRLGIVKSLQISNDGFSQVENPVKKYWSGWFQMPLHYLHYKKEGYEKMEEWKVEVFLQQYGLNFKGTLAEKRAYAMGVFILMA